MNEFAFVYAALAVGLVGLFVTLWEARIAKTSIDTVGKNPELNGELKGLTILGIALVESAAIYALLVAILITFTDGVSATKAMAAMFAVALPGMLAWVGEASIVVAAIKAIQRNPSAASDIRGNMIIFIALVESAAIYGLVTALLILFK
jgi:F-type H+-transporting ATPase subunit c